MTPEDPEFRKQIRSKLYSGDLGIGVWGTGFIGFSTLANFANHGVRSSGFDIDPDIVASINEGKIPIDNLEYWLGFETEPLVEDGVLTATTDHTDIIDENTPIHFVAIPTEKEGVPWNGALEDTIEKITEFEKESFEEPILVIVESTLTPGMSDEVIFPILSDSSLKVGEEIVVGVAPRRDWFISPDKNLRSLPRVYGGQNQFASEYMEAVLSIVCENLVRSPDHRHAELTKSIENAYRHVGITLANQLSRAYPEIDMREVLKMVGTKWNIATYYPSVGTGGYCIPLSSQYVLNGTENEEELSILSQTVESDREQPFRVADAIAEHGVDSVAILGLAYKGDVKVDILSPTKTITERLTKHGIDVRIHDPYFSDDYIESETGAAATTFPKGLEGMDAVIIVADHRKYSYIPDGNIVEALQDCQLVLDNHRIWEDIPLDENGTEYHYTGGKQWLGGTEPGTEKMSPQ